nr:ribonuclease H-like domain-containing protein [Tanacetum cinerariifolium]
MRIEQYFFMTDYSLWEVILNGDSPAPTRVVDGVVQPLKFNSLKYAKTLMEEIKKSTNEPVSASPSVSAVSAKMLVSSLPNVDSLSNDVIYLFFATQSSSPQLYNDDLKQIDADDLEEMDLKWQMAMLTVECYNCHRKGHFARECRSLKDTRRNARKNELKDCGTLLMALPDKHQLKFNTHKDAKTLIEEIEKRLQKLISQLEILRVSLSQEDINLKFLRSLPTEWRTHTLIWRNKTDLEDQFLESKDPQVVSEPFGELCLRDTFSTYKNLFSVPMKSLSPQVVSAAKLPIMNPNEFDLWKMRIEQYFLMTDYSLWEVILNGDSPAPTRVIDGVLQPVAHTNAEQRLARKNELKAREKRFGGNIETKKVQKTLLKQQYENFIGSSSESLDQIHDRLQKLISQLEILGVSLSQEDINLKFFRSLPNEWRTHTLIWRNKTDLEEQSLDDLFNSLKIYEAKVKSSSSASTTIQNIAFVSSSNTDSTNEPISVAASVFAVSAKIPVSALPNVDSLSNAIDADDLEEMDLKWQMAMLTVRARRFIQKTGRNLRANVPTSMGFDMSKVECYNCHRKGHFARECRSSKYTRRNGAAEPQRRNVPVETSSSNALVFQCDGVGYNSQVFTRAIFDCDDYLSSGSDESLPPSPIYDSDESLPPSPIYDRYQSGNGYHAVSPPYTGTFMPPKPDLVFNNAPNAVETDHPAFNVKLSSTKPDNALSHTHRPSAPIIEDWVSDLEDDSETKTPQNVPSFVQPTEQPTSNGNHQNRKACFVCKSLDHLIKDCDYHKQKMAQTTARNNANIGAHKKYAQMTHLNPHRHVVLAPVLTQSKLIPIIAVRPVTTAFPKPSVTRPRQAKTVVTKPTSPPRRHIDHSPSPKASNFPLKVTAVKAPMVNAATGVQGNRNGNQNGNPQHSLKDKGVIDSGCSRHMIGNMSYLSDFEELYGGYVAFGGNPKGVLLRVPKENNMYNVDLKNIVPSGDLTCLFAKATLDESNLWHRRLAHINFKTMNKLVKGNLVRGLPSKVFENDNTCVACKKGKQHRASCKTKPVSSVNQPLHRLHMDLFGPTFVKSLNKKSFCLVVTDDYSRFTWVFFLATKDETSPILKTFLTGLEN